MKSRSPAPSKKKYRAPRLIVYGDLRALTSMVGAKAAPDGGPMMLMSKS